MVLSVTTAVRADAPAAKESIEADASTRQVAITSSFTGTEILVFGAVGNSTQPSPEAGTYDIIVVVEGVAAPVVVRMKSRVGGIWVNTQSMQFASVPTYYAIASTRPVDEIANRAVLDAHGIGFDHVRMVRAAQSRIDATDPAELQDFRQALIRLKEKERVYVRSDFGVSFVGRSLFRATIALPPNVPVAPLTAHVYLFKDGQMLGQYDSRVMLQREGIERYIHETALTHPLFYGLFSVAMAAGCGLAAAFAFRRPA
jgi:uncharacterized protein (TIGR02186 family)